MTTNAKRSTVWSGLALGASAASLAILVAAQTASAAPYISRNFDGDIANAAPSGTSDYSAPANTRAIVVDNTTTPTDPFGGSGNKSLLLENTRDINNSGYTLVAFKGAPSGLTSGTFSATIYSANTAGFAAPSNQIRIGINNTENGSDIAAWVSFTDTYFRLNNSITLDQVPTANTAYNLTLTFDTATHKYTGTIQQVGSQTVTPLTADHGATTSFNFNTNLNSITSIGLLGGWSGNQQTRGFFDNLQMSEVPEPGSLGLLGLGGLLLLRRRKEK